MTVNKLKEVLEEIDLPVMVEIVDKSPWYRSCSEEISWNTDGNEEDLENGEGSTYSVEAYGASTEYDGYLVVNANTGCGETVTYFFNLENEVEFE